MQEPQHGGHARLSMLGATAAMATILVISVAAGAERAPWAFAALCSTASTAGAILIGQAWRGTGRALRTAARHWPLTLCGSANSLGAALLATSIGLAGPTLATILYELWPMATILCLLAWPKLACVRRTGSDHGALWAGLGCCAVGVAALAIGQQNPEGGLGASLGAIALDGRTALGILAGLGAAAASGTAISANRGLAYELRRADPSLGRTRTEILGFAFPAALGMTAAWIVALTRDATWTAVDARLVVGALASGAVGTGAAVMYRTAMRLMPHYGTMALAYATPLLTLLGLGGLGLATTVHGTEPNWAWAGIGTLAIVGGNYLATRQPRNSGRPATVRVTAAAVLLTVAIGSAAGLGTATASEYDIRDEREMHEFFNRPQRVTSAAECSRDAWLAQAPALDGYQTELGATWVATTGQAWAQCEWLTACQTSPGVRRECTAVRHCAEGRAPPATARIGTWPQPSACAAIRQCPAITHMARRCYR